jgi:colanic acid/amylovoran biosynthesis glycosyltransferase
MNKLAIYSPNLGAISETFIKRHMEELAPGKTVVIAGSDQPPHYGHWSVDCPTLILSNRNTVFPKKFSTKLRLTILNSLGFKAKNNLYYNKELADFLIKNNVKIILAEYLDYSTTIIDLAKKLGIKLYAHAHGFDVSARLKEKFWRREYLKFNETNGVITVSKYSKDKLVKIGIKKELIHVIPCGIKIPSKFTKTSNGKQIKCISVGRMVSKKAPILLLKSFKKASSQNDLLTLDFVGSGVLYKEALQFIRDNNLADKVTLHGRIENDEVINMMKDADIFLQHSITDPVSGDQEGLPVAILEAMVHCLPVISTLHAGIPEAVIHNQSGLLVKEKDTSAMAKAILMLANNKNLRTNMGIAGRKIIEQKFTWQIEKESLLNLINSRENELMLNKSMPETNFSKAINFKD